jgi:hypothetical protein
MCRGIATISPLLELFRTSLQDGLVKQWKFQIHTSCSASGQKVMLKILLSEYLNWTPAILHILQ